MAGEITPEKLVSSHLKLLLGFSRSNLGNKEGGSIPTYKIKGLDSDPKQAGVGNNLAQDATPHREDERLTLSPGIITSFGMLL